MKRLRMPKSEHLKPKVESTVREYFRYGIRDENCRKMEKDKIPILTNSTIQQLAYEVETGGKREARRLEKRISIDKRDKFRGICLKR
jgi:negative regulator of sigma E activity